MENLDEYKKILYGFASLQEKTEVQPERALAIPVEETLDIVPSSIDAIVAAQAGHTENYLLKKCREYQITTGQLFDLVYLKGHYKTDFPTMIGFIDRGYSMSDIRELLETRESFSSLVLDSDWRGKLVAKLSDVPSLKQLAEFHEVFGCTEPDAELMREQLTSLHEATGCRFYDESIKLAIKRAKEIDSTILETVVSSLETGFVDNSTDEDPYDGDSFP